MSAITSCNLASGQVYRIYCSYFLSSLQHTKSTLCFWDNSRHSNLGHSRRDRPR